MGRRSRRKIKITKPKKPEKEAKPRSSNYRNYDTKDVELAFKDVTDKKMSIRAAAVKHGVPASTLRDRVHGRIKMDTTQSGPPPFMPKEDERTFVKHMLMLKAIGYRYRQIDIANAAADYGHYYGKRDISEGPMSRGWIKKFVDRQKKQVTYQEYHFRAKCPFPPPQIQKKYFDELESIMIIHKLKNRPHLIYSLSETTLDSDPDGDHDPEATLFSCVNALGLKLPPFFIFNGKKPNAKLTRGGPDGLGAVMSETGGPNSRIMQHYLKDHFLKNLEAEEEDENTHVLLLYDGHKSRILFPVIKWALEHKIILFVIPPHCTITVEPCQVANFNPMEKCFQRECASFAKKHEGKAIDKYNVCRTASKAHDKVFTPNSIMTCFHDSGVYPLRPKVFQKAPEPLPNQIQQTNRKRRRPHAPVARKGFFKARALGKMYRPKKMKTDADSDSSDDGMSDLYTDSEDEVDIPLDHSTTTQDHSYGTSSSTLEEGVISDNEVGVTPVIEESLVHVPDKWAVNVVQNDQESAALAAETIVVKHESVPVDGGSAEVVLSELAQDIYVQTGDNEGRVSSSVTVSTVGQSHISVKTETVEAATDTMELNEVAVKPEINLEDSIPESTATSVVKTMEAVKSTISETSVGMSGEISSIDDMTEYVKSTGGNTTQFLLIRPKSEPGTPEVSERGGRLIPLVSSTPSDDKNLVIKVIELSQDMYDKVMEGGEVVIRETNSSD